MTKEISKKSVFSNLKSKRKITETRGKAGTAKGDQRTPAAREKNLKSMGDKPLKPGSDTSGLLKKRWKELMAEMPEHLGAKKYRKQSSGGTMTDEAFLIAAMKILNKYRGMSLTDEEIENPYNLMALKIALGMALTDREAAVARSAQVSIDLNDPEIREKYIDKNTGIPDWDRMAEDIHSGKLKPSVDNDALSDKFPKTDASVHASNKKMDDKLREKMSKSAKSMAAIASGFELDDEDFDADLADAQDADDIATLTRGGRLY